MVNVFCRLYAKLCFKGLSPGLEELICDKIGNGHESYSIKVDNLGQLAQIEGNASGSLLPTAVKFTDLCRNDSE